MLQTRFVQVRCYSAEVLINQSVNCRCLLVLTQCAPTFRCLGGGPRTPLAGIVLNATIHCNHWEQSSSQFNDSVAVYYISSKQYKNPCEESDSNSDLLFDLVFCKTESLHHLSAQSSFFLSSLVISGVICKWFVWIGL